MSTLEMTRVQDLSQEFGVPLSDAILTAINLYGISSDTPSHRARLRVHILDQPGPGWMVIVPLNARSSPFTAVDGELFLEGEWVGAIEAVTSDQAVGGYFRNEHKAVTLNPNARSRCVGCAFCPNTLEPAADPRVTARFGIDELLSALEAQHPAHDLTQLREVTVSTGCFEFEDPAVDHMIELRSALDDWGIAARLGFLSSVVRSEDALSVLAARAAPFVLRLTIECFTRRPLLLKASKADLVLPEMKRILASAKAKGLGTSYTYIVGLDAIDEMEEGISQVSEFVTDFPNFQVYQAHNAIMSGIRVPGADELRFYLEARSVIERVFGGTELRPQSWEGYRPLWYTSYGDTFLSDGNFDG